MSDTIRVLFIADIVGQPGLDVLHHQLPGLIRHHQPHLVIANGENAHEGFGINEEIVHQLYDWGVHVITGGNHSFDKWKILPYMKTDHRLLRPLNYPKGASGYGFGIYDVPGTPYRLGVLNLQGRTFLPAIDDPFRGADWAVERIREETPLVFVDMHAEATAEKAAMAWYLDGRVSVVVGTHTHVPTNDARILEKGTGFITDAGMTGSFRSVIGMDVDQAIRRFTLGTPQKYREAIGDERVCAVLCELDPDNGACLSIQPVIVPEFERHV